MSVHTNTVQKILSILLFFISPALLSAHGGEDVCVVCKHIDESQPKPAPSFDVLKVDVPDWFFNHPADCFVGVSLPLHDAILAEQQALMFAGMIASRHDYIDDNSTSMVSYNDGDIYQTTSRSGRVLFDIPTYYQIVEKEVLSDGCLAILVRFSFGDGIRKMAYEYRDDYSSYHRNDSLSFDKGFRAEYFSTDNFRISCTSELGSTSTYCVYYNDLKETCICNAKVPCEYQYTARDEQPRSIDGSLPDGTISFNIPVIGNIGYTLWSGFVYNEIESAVMCDTNYYSSPDLIVAKTNQAIFDKKITFEMGGWNSVYEYVVVRYDFKNKAGE
ncbi:MAG: hypothetical protein Q4F69_12680 [Bacteroidia bacterium]|nr:hypothetical protein [Bacteroidia bacterium]